VYQLDHSAQLSPAFYSPVALMLLGLMFRGVDFELRQSNVRCGVVVRRVAGFE